MGVFGGGGGEVSGILSEDERARIWDIGYRRRGRLMVMQH